MVSVNALVSVRTTRARGRRHQSAIASTAWLCC